MLSPRLPAAAARVPLAALLAATLAALAASPLRAQPGPRRLADTDELLRRAMVAFEALPRSIGPADAPLFGDALAYLYAYEQRLLREGGGSLTGLPADAMAWLAENVAGLGTGKADRFRDDAALLERGNERWSVLVDSRVGSGRYWALGSYVSALANLYAYVQVGGRGGDAADRVRQLATIRGRLVSAGGRADAAREAEVWAPSSPKPGTSPYAVFRDGVVTEVTILDPPPGGGVPGDSLREVAAALRAENEELARENRALTAENAELRAAAERGGADLDVFLQWAEKILDGGDVRGAHAVTRAVLAVDRDRVQAHLLMADVYAAAVESRPEPTPRDRALHWLALDHLERAAALVRGAGRRPDRALLARLGDGLRSARAGAPGPEEVAALGWRSGQPLRIDFPPWEWVGEGTRVR